MSAKRRCCAWPPNTVASRGAVALARWDPGIEYTVPDAKHHTFRMEHDRPGIGHMSDGSTYPVGHTIITANGIKPSSVMSWIHREKPGSPEWEHRARQRTRPRPNPIC